MAANLPTGLVTHTRKVQSLYKKALRTTQAWYDHRPSFRFRAVLLRQRFDENKDVKDMIEAKRLLEAGEEELFKNQHWQPINFPESPGGVAYEREVVPPDWVIDYWHPLEKARFPEYFARREQRKKEYVKLWEQQFGKSTGGHH